MTWQCKLLDVVGTKAVRFPAPPGGGICGETQLVTADGQAHRYDDLPPGTMFYVPEKPTHEGDDDQSPWPWFMVKEDDLSDYYRQNNFGRRPLLVILPSRELFLIDGKCWEGARKYGGWQVTGAAPNITVSPSINLVGIYHGYLQNGVISDDCEGRRFDEMGRKIR